MRILQCLKRIYLFPLSVLMGAVPDNTYTTTLGVSNNREDLSDTIYQIAPVDTLLTSKMAQVKATGVKH